MSFISFEESGEGPPLVLLHGFCETREIWSGFIDPLSSHFRVIVPDLPGFGKSTLPKGPFGIDDVGDLVADWLAGNRITNSVIIGHSLGGYVTLSIARRHTSMVKGFGLFHSTAFSDSAEKKENRNKVIAFVTKNGVPPYIDAFVPGLFFDKQHPALPLVHRIASKTSATTLTSYSLAMRDRADRTSVLTENEIPKLLIAGQEDALIPIQSSQEMAKIGLNLKFHVLPNVGHMGFFEDKSECQSIITRFTESTYSN